MSIACNVPCTWYLKCNLKSSVRSATQWNSRTTWYKFRKRIRSRCARALFPYTVVVVAPHHLAPPTITCPTPPPSPPFPAGDVAFVSDSSVSYAHEPQSSPGETTSSNHPLSVSHEDDVNRQWRWLVYCDIGWRRDEDLTAADDPTTGKTPSASAESDLTFCHRQN